MEGREEEGVEAPHATCFGEGHDEGAAGRRGDARVKVLPRPVEHRARQQEVHRRVPPMMRRRQRRVESTAQHCVTALRQLRMRENRGGKTFSGGWRGRGKEGGRGAVK